MFIANYSLTSNIIIPQKNGNFNRLRLFYKIFAAKPACARPQYARNTTQRTRIAAVSAHSRLLSDERMHG